MSLQERLSAIRAGATQRIPPDTLAVMQRATADLRASGIVERAIQVGARLPAFALTGARGNTVESKDLLSRGAVVLTVFRGHW